MILFLTKYNIQLNECKMTENSSAKKQYKLDADSKYLVALKTGTSQTLKQILTNASLAHISCDHQQYH